MRVNYLKNTGERASTERSEVERLERENLWLKSPLLYHCVTSYNDKEMF
jgi:hypothetical protein